MHTHAPARLLGLPSALWRGYQRRQSRRAVTAALRQMDDHILRDIGLSRGDIEAAIRSAGPHH
jgi:uncharacterized protein YjiS (DUF1127 family)